jgi:ribonuclease HI
MAAGGKFYVVWEGLAPGIYTSWEECEAQVKGFAGARYKAFRNIEDATRAFRGSLDDQASLLLSVARYAKQHATAPGHICDRFPAIRRDAIAVDAACSGVPGPMEYQGVEVATGRRLFHFGPIPGATNNIGEYLALVHALAMLDQRGDHTTPIYSDSRTALSWLRNHGAKTTLQRTDANARVFELLRRADLWVKTHSLLNPVIKWDTKTWGEIPADFGRK